MRTLVILTLATCGIAAAGMAGHQVSQAYIAHLGEELRTQCATRDWPKSQDRDHVEFCAAHRLPVGTHYATGEYTGR